MTIVFSEPEGDKVVEVRLSGKLHKADYERFVPEVEKAITANGKIRVFMEMPDWHAPGFARRVTAPPSSTASITKTSGALR